MISMTADQQEKIALIDKFFSAMSVDQLREFVEREEIVAALKGTTDQGFLSQMLAEHNRVHADLNRVLLDVATLKLDLQTVIKAMDKPYYYGSDFNNLKMKNGIY